MKPSAVKRAFESNTAIAVKCGMPFIPGVAMRHFVFMYCTFSGQLHWSLFPVTDARLKATARPKTDWGKLLRETPIVRLPYSTFNEYEPNLVPRGEAVSQADHLRRQREAERLAHSKVDSPFIPLAQREAISRRLSEERRRREEADRHRSEEMSMSERLQWINWGLQQSGALAGMQHDHFAPPVPVEPPKPPPPPVEPRRRVVG